MTAGNAAAPRCTGDRCGRPQHCASPNMRRDRGRGLMIISRRSVRGTLMLGAATAAMLTASAAWAQTDQQDSDQTQPADDTAQSATTDAAVPGDIVVKGFRASVENSIAAKRNAPIIVDVVTADDIAGLPDVSIAD